MPLEKDPLRLLGPLPSAAPRPPPGPPGNRPSQLFLRARVNSEPLPRRHVVRNLEGAAERARQLHSLMWNQSPYSKHLEIAEARAQEGRLEDAACARENRARLREMHKHIDEQCERNKERIRQEVRAYSRRKQAGSKELLDKLDGTQRDYSAWRREMEKRVLAAPSINGDRPVTLSQEELAERQQQSQRQMRAHAATYQRDLRKIKESLAERRPASAGELQSEDAAEERRLARLGQLSRQAREYGAFLDDVYGRLDNAGSRTSTFRTVDPDYLEQQAATRTLKLEEAATQAQRHRTWRKDLDAKMRSRPRAYGGYTPVPCSERRRCNELADSEAVEITGGTRTMSPRALGLASAQTKRLSQSEPSLNATRSG